MASGFADNIFLILKAAVREQPPFFIHILSPSAADNVELHNNIHRFII